MLLRSFLYTIFTVYMMAILAVWLGPKIDFDLSERRWGIWIVRLVDPLLKFLRKTLPYFGPFDWTPIIALMILWIIRKILTGI